MYPSQAAARSGAARTSALRHTPPFTVTRIVYAVKYFCNSFCGGATPTRLRLPQGRVYAHQPL